MFISTSFVSASFGFMRPLFMFIYTSFGSASFGFMRPEPAAGFDAPWGPIWPSGIDVARIADFVTGSPMRISSLFSI